MYVAGQHNAICMRCGFSYKSGQIRLEWTGLRVCKGCLDQRHPQDDVKGKTDKQTPPWVSPEAPDVFVTQQISWDDL